ncbi:bacillithiol biosynthesis cysteine-adding enzyme BshC [Sporosarcina sp. FA9]|uniref:bacillithiol biosynthesis cysteine-adding enzyme BshC n=1 Tax=Sporosarcina sp. FA9 TaxID=3413030 RepID=UPI003F657481
MNLEMLALPEKNKVMQSYTNDPEFLHTYFDYIIEESSFFIRNKELSERSFQRSELKEVLISFMKPFGISDAAQKHIDELALNGVAVVGGQQAGLLTGPLYSVHKAISVLLLAKQQRELLGIPVVPVFWVAGEDHDLNEINHVHTVADYRVSKKQYREKYILKLMASDATFKQDQMAEFVKEIFGTYGETVYTKDLLAEVLDALKKESTFTGFFVRLMNGLFQDEGLLFLDSAYQPLREIESDYFIQLINESEEIASLIHQKEQQFDSAGFGTPMDVKLDGANLFFVHETGRVLLTRENSYFINDSVGIRFTKEELLKIAKQEPWLLSNNVATRPIMQDFVFPVLAFVGGPGEIAYWAVLKDAFHHLQMKMPIIVPRMSITLVTSKTRQALDSKSVTFSDVISGEFIAVREEVIDDLRDDPFNNAVDETKEMVKVQYDKLKEMISKEDTNFIELLQKNLKFHERQFEYLKEKSDENIYIKHDALLRAFGLIESELFPEGSLQERMYTPYAYLNSYGPTLIRDLLELPFEMDGTHKIVYL